MISNNPFESGPADGVTRLILVRHAQTDANARHYLQGQSDGVLNETGLVQAAEIAEVLSSFFIEKIYSSDQKRAVATAKAIASKHAMEVKTDPRLQEWNCGDWDGMPAVEFLGMVEQEGLTPSTLRPPNGETFQQIRARAEAVLAEILSQSEGQSVLIVSHGDFTRSLIGLLMGIDADIAANIILDNASYSVLEKHEDGWKIITINRIS